MAEITSYNDDENLIQDENLPNLVSESEIYISENEELY